MREREEHMLRFEYIFSFQSKWKKMFLPVGTEAGLGSLSYNIVER